MIEVENLRGDYASFYEQGAFAFSNERPVDECPYPSGSAESDAWLSGYRSAESRKQSIN